MFRTLTLIAAIALTGAAYAQYDYSQMTPLQARIKGCYTEAGAQHLKGKRQSAFVDHCLRASSHATNSAAGSGRLKR
jgi:hypothetical protein